jgi:hypothetical protein
VGGHIQDDILIRSSSFFYCANLPDSWFVEVQVGVHKAFMLCLGFI